MTVSGPAPGMERQWAFFMDLLSHDILNNNQAVLSYLELVLANPEMNAKARSYAEKAMAHVRTSTLLVEHAKNLMAARSIDSNSLRPIDLMRSVMLASKEIPRFFPSKNIRVRVTQSPPDAYVLGDVLAEDLVLNAFIDIVRADPGDEVDLDVKVVRSGQGNKMSWSLVLSDPNVVLQPGMKSEDISNLVTQDNSKMVRMAGFLFARIAAQLLGGEFKTRELEEAPGRGGEFTLTLVKAGKP